MNAEFLMMIMNAGTGLICAIAIFMFSRKLTRMDRKNDARYAERLKNEILHCNLHIQSGDLLITHIDKAVESGENSRQKELLPTFKESQKNYKESITEAAADRTVYK